GVGLRPALPHGPRTREPAGDPVFDRSTPRRAAPPSGADPRGGRAAGGNTAGDHAPGDRRSHVSQLVSWFRTGKSQVQSLSSSALGQNSAGRSGDPMATLSLVLPLSRFTR